MPGNRMTINDSISYYVGDSKMPQLMKLLDEIGSLVESGKIVEPSKCNLDSAYKH